MSRNFPSSVSECIKFNTRDIFKFWRAVEALTPQKSDKQNQHHPISPIYSINGDTRFPWKNPTHLSKRCGNHKIWRYTLQCGIYDTSEITKRLVAKIGAHEDVFDENRSMGLSRLFDLGFDENGYPIPESFVLSLACWSAGQILHNNNGIEALEAGGKIDTSEPNEQHENVPLIKSGYDGFDYLSRQFIFRLITKTNGFLKFGTPPDKKWVNDCVKLILGKCGFPEAVIGPTPAYIAKCWQIQKKAVQKNDKPLKPNSGRTTQANDLLNSFFIGDLKLIEDAVKRNEIGRGLVEYITSVAQREKRTRVDLRSANGVRTAYQLLSPDRIPRGCWPSDYSLAFSQQLAVNETWHKLSNGTGLFAINGPPGTGKTTLLRDIVATVVVERARKIAAACAQKNSAIFKEKSVKKIGDTRIPYYEMREFVGDGAIVVASANNGAVENISLELPGIGAVPDRVVNNVDYFTDLAKSVLGKPSWGLIAARLGNKKNRNEFLDEFWWKTPDEHPTNEAGRHQIDQANGGGLRYHLKQIQEGMRDPLLSLEKAINQFNEAMLREKSIRKYAIERAELSGCAEATKQQIKKENVAMKTLKQEEKQQSGFVKHLDSNAARAEANYSSISGTLDENRMMMKDHNVMKPGFMIWLSTLGRSHREWWDRRRGIEAQIDALRKKQEAQEKVRFAAGRRCAAERKRLDSITRRAGMKQSFLVEAQNKLDALNMQIRVAKESLGINWPELGLDDEVREKSSPWATKDWFRAREDTFLAALQLHRAFIEGHPTEMLVNLNLASDWLKGRRLPEIMARTAFHSLCLVVPVISTTFASVPRIFADITPEGIGWLLIDEGGQALPQQAAGAIWRAKRVLVVGDPNQLEPVISISPVVEGSLAKYYGVDHRWWPSETSAQRLADQTVDIGAWLPGAEEEKIWVGCPLRVHRRCDDPMFSISNRIAYGGMMVREKPKSESPLPESQWIDVRSESGEGHWVPDEGEAARKLIRELIENYGLGQERIFLISPFKDCAKYLRSLARELNLDKLSRDKTGTVHTTQGKEADVVILVLGGNPKRPGAKDWAAKKPNLLNVAVSRAKKRLYVIGNKDEWGKKRFFRVAAEYLPTKPLRSPNDAG